jgi:hypothetical protein
MKTVRVDIKTQFALCLTANPELGSPGRGKREPQHL